MVRVQVCARIVAGAALLAAAGCTVAYRDSAEDDACNYQVGANLDGLSGGAGQKFINTNHWIGTAATVALTPAGGSMFSPCDPDQSWRVSLGSVSREVWWRADEDIRADGIWAPPLNPAQPSVARVGVQHTLGPIVWAIFSYDPLSKHYKVSITDADGPEQTLVERDATVQPIPPGNLVITLHNDSGAVLGWGAAYYDGMSFSASGSTAIPPTEPYRFFFMESVSNTHLYVQHLHVGTAPPVIIVSQPQDTSAEVGTPASFTVATTGGGAAVTYDWMASTGFGAPWSLSGPGTFSMGPGSNPAFALRTDALGAVTRVSRDLPDDAARFVVVEGEFDPDSVATLGVGDANGPIVGVSADPVGGRYQVFGPAFASQTTNPVGGGLYVVFDLVDGLIVTQQRDGARVTGTFPAGLLPPGPLRLYASVEGADASLGIRGLLARDESGQHVRADRPGAPQYLSGPPGLAGIDGGYATIPGAPRTTTLDVTPTAAGSFEFVCMAQGIDDFGALTEPARLTATWPTPDVTTPTVTCTDTTTQAQVQGAAGGDVSWSVTDGAGQVVGQVLGTSADGTTVDFVVPEAGLPAGLRFIVVAADVAHPDGDLHSEEILSLISVAGASIRPTFPSVCALAADGARTTDLGPDVAYLWSITNGVITGGQGTSFVDFQAGATGPVGLGLTVSGGTCQVQTSASVTIHGPSAVVTAPATVNSGSANNIASVPDSGGFCSWFISGGSITSGQGTREIHFTAGAPGSLVLTVTVYDAQFTSCFGQKTIDVVQGPPNTSPTIASIGNQTIDEGMSFSLPLTIGDTETATSGLTVEVTGLPGAFIASAGGGFSLEWTPVEAQGPGDFSATVTVTDPGGLIASAGFQVQVSEVNGPPFPGAVQDAFVLIGALIFVPLSASDPDIPANALAWSLDDPVPPDAVVDPASGYFSWIPTVAGTYPVIARVTDNGTPPLSTSVGFTIQVEEPSGDFDGDGAPNFQDCAPADPGAWAIPAETTLMFALDGETLSWDSLAPGAGSATVHDIVRGLVSELPVGSGASEACFVYATPSIEAADAGIPSVGQGFYYLVRGRNVCGVGTYGFASNGSWRLSSACP